MMTSKMKKIKLIIARDDFGCVLRVLVRLGCIEVSDPEEEYLEDPELGNLVARVIVTLENFNANLDSITMLGTQYTFILTGWMTARSEMELTAQLSKYICAWEIEDPSPEELDKVPVKLRFPKFAGLFYKGNGKPFNPLTNGQHSEYITQGTQADDHKVGEE